MINAVKKLLDVAFQNEAGLSAIAAHSPRHLSERSHALMVAEADPTGKRGRNESFFKNRIQYGENRMVQYAVPNGCLMNVPLLRVADIKTFIRAMPVFLAFQIPMKLKNILFEISFKFHDIPF